MTEDLRIGSLEAPDETTEFDNGHLETTTVSGATFMLGTVEPGWLWSRRQRTRAGSRTVPARPPRVHARGRNDGRDGRWLDGNY